MEEARLLKRKVDISGAVSIFGQKCHAPSLLDHIGETVHILGSADKWILFTDQEQFITCLAR